MATKDEEIAFLCSSWMSGTNRMAKDYTVLGLRSLPGAHVEDTYTLQREGATRSWFMISELLVRHHVMHHWQSRSRQQSPRLSQASRIGTGLRPSTLETFAN